MTKEEKIEYQKKYYMAHAEKYKNSYALNKEKIRERQKEWYVVNKEKILLSSKEYQVTHKENIAKRKKKHHEEERERDAERNKEWRIANKEKIAKYLATHREKTKEQTRKYLTKKRLFDKRFILDKRMSGLIRVSLKRNGGDKAGESWKYYVGYTITQLKSHLEKQFTSGMTWDLFLNLSGRKIIEKKPQS